MTANQTSILKSALLHDALSEIKYFESLPIKKPEYSEGFKRKIDELMNEKPVKKHTLSKKLVFILVAAILSVLLIASTSAIAIKYREYFVSIYERFIEIVFVNDGDEKLTVEEIYTPSYIPSGYTKTNEILRSASHKSIWSNLEHTIIFEQKIHRNGSLLLDNESNEYQTFELDGKTVYYYTKHNTTYYSWCYGEYMFFINCNSGISLDEIKLMISSMVPATAKTFSTCFFARVAP